MKLAGFGVIVAAVGLIMGIDGLLLSGGLWLATGLLLRALVQRGKSEYAVDAGVESDIGRIEAGEDRTPRLGLPGVFLLLVAGLGSIAIGISGTGFPDDYEYLRWLPFAVGILITMVGLVSIPVELGIIKQGAKPEDWQALDEKREAGIDLMAEGHDERDPEERLTQLDGLRRRGLVTAEEYEAQRDRILRSI